MQTLSHRHIQCWGACVFFFFKHKTAYEIATGDGSSDVCSSDLSPKTHTPNTSTHTHTHTHTHTLTHTSTHTHTHPHTRTHIQAHTHINLIRWTTGVRPNDKQSACSQTPWHHRWNMDFHQSQKLMDIMCVCQCACVCVCVGIPPIISSCRIGL